MESDAWGQNIKTQWSKWPPSMEIEEQGWFWLRDAKRYLAPIVVYLNCNQAKKIGVSFNELDDLPVDWKSAEYARCIAPR